MGLLDDAIREHLELKRRAGASDEELRRQEAEAFGPAGREPEPAEPAAAEEDEAWEDEAWEDEPAAEEAPRVEEEPVAYADDEAPAVHLEEEPVAYADDEAAAPPAHEEPAPFAEAASSAGEADLLEPTPFEPDARYGEDAPPEPPAGGDETQAFDVVASFEAEDAGGEEPGPQERPASAAGEPADLPPLSDSQLSLDEGGPPRRGDTPPYGIAAVPPDEGLGEVEPAIDEPVQHAGGEAGEPGDGEDVLEETPDFLQDAPEHDRLWFEQRPPRDFDFDD